jgi:hypothetical protein
MFTTTQLILGLQCGKYDYLCCIGSSEKLRILRDLLDGATNDDLDALYQAVCQCKPGGAYYKPPASGAPSGTNQWPEPGTGGGGDATCASRLTSAMCGAWTQGAISAAQTALAAAAVVANLSSKWKKILLATTGMLEAWSLACSNPSLDSTLIRGSCAVWSKMMEWKAASGVLAVLLTPVYGLFEAEVGLALGACCSNAPAADVPLPDWATDLPGAPTAADADQQA